MNESQLKRYSLSPAQKSLLFINRLTPRSIAYDVLAAYRLNKNVSDADLTQAINEVISRHPVLSCSIENRNSKECLVEGRYTSIEPEVIELSDKKWQEMPDCILPGDFPPFDLGKEMLFQVYLYRNRKNAPVLLFRTHHILCEYWSIGIIVRELQLIFQGIIENRPIDLPEAPAYFEFIDWQRRFLNTLEASKSLEYWYHKLEKASHLISLPYDFRHPDRPSLKGGIVSFELSSEKTKSLVKLGKSQGVALYATVLSSFCVLLHRYSGQSELLIGTPTLGRPDADFRKSVGYYVNTVVIKATLESNPTFIELMKRLGAEVKESLAQQQIPFSAVVDHINPKRRAGSSPLYQVLFDLLSPDRFKRIIERTVPSSKKAGKDFDFAPLLIPHQEGQFDLSLQVIEDKNGLVFLLKYSSDVFKKTTIQHISENFKQLLDSIIADPEQQIGSIPLLCEVERNLLKNLYQPARQQIEKFPLTVWFERTAARFPEKTALRYGEKTISYSQLNQRAHIVAFKLLEKELKPKTFIAIQLQPSIEMMVAILGILKAGHAYLPLDRSLPKNRVDTILTEAQANTIISRRNLNEYTGQFNLDWIWIEDIDFNIEKTASSSPGDSIEISGHDPAYVIFTSGSTGKPKGVMVSHDNVSHLLAHLLKKMDFSHNDTWTLFHSVSFDFSVWEIWGALASGATIVIVPQEITKDLRAFHHLVKQECITILNLTPAAFFQYAKIDSINSKPEKNSLRTVILGGERLDVRRLKSWFKTHSDDSPKLINMYGITETTVISTFRPIKSADISQCSSPIGSPFDDSALYLLDDNREEVPVGVEGEIYIAGNGVTSGYLHNQEQTNKVFSKGSPRHPEEFMYRTGDRARITTEGELEYVGRSDYQVKIRGYRIELSEIEIVAEKHEKVDQAVVCTRKNDSFEMQLVIYLVLRKDEDEVNEETLRLFFGNYLPNHMIPTHIIFLEQIPISSNGKVDYQRLPDPHKLQRADKLFSETEEMKVLRQIWSRLLEKDITDVDLDFFAAGGDSLSSMQLELEIEEKLGKSIPLSRLINNPTIRGQAALIRDAALKDSPKVKRPSKVSAKKNEGWWKKNVALIKRAVLAMIITTIYKMILITVRIVELNKPKELPGKNNEKQPFQFAHWHGEGLMLLYPWRNKNLNLLASKSPDGQLAAAVVKKFGYEFVHGSSSSDGLTGLLQLAQSAKEGKSTALAVDGSRGPIHRVKPGVVELARQTQVPIQTVVCICNRGWVLEKSWDKMRIPKPFSKVFIKYGPAIPPPPPDKHLHSDSFKKTVQEVEDALKQTKGEIKDSLSCSNY
ncbi:MAG: amino acid adenylation domain-containing protein [Deltaproteobacteria bacterium]|nr:amino acid adenylation domain-containing protein [Deltaproteobacteria bacterium]